jgi:L-ascorbate metabolism protein UlaG (beta-lactamase superfamily)
MANRGFQELLTQRLGVMKDVLKAVRPKPTFPDSPESLYFRRAVGLEVNFRPDDSWKRAEVRRRDWPEKTHECLDMEDLQVLVGLTRWTQGTALTGRVSVKNLVDWAQKGLLFFSRRSEDRTLPGEGGVLDHDGAGRVVLAGSVWPTAAMETAIEIAPMPFMPRGEDLRGAALVGARFAVLDRGYEVFGVTISGGPRTGHALRNLIAVLNRGFDGESLKETKPVSMEPMQHKLLLFLDAMGLLERDTAAYRAVVSESVLPVVTWLGHAAVLVQMDGVNLLVDPLFFSRSRLESPGTEYKFDPRKLPDLDAVLITHGDNDHLNPNSLLRLPEDVPIVYPEIPEPRADYQVDMRGILSCLGFRKLRPMVEGQSFRVGPLEIVACPFDGECWDLPLRQLTYLVRGPSASLYFGADSRLDEESMGAVAAHGPIDLAFLGVSGCAEAYVMPEGFGYGNFYERWVPFAQHNEWVQHCAGPEEAARATAILRPRFAFGYACGGANYIRTEYSDTGSHRAFREALRRSEGRDECVTEALDLPLGLPFLLPTTAGLP